MVDLIPAAINILGTEIELLKLLITAVIIAVGVLVARIARLTITRFVGRYLPHETGEIIKRGIYWGIIAIAVFSAIGNLGVDFTGLLLAGGIMGIIVGFAVQSTVANLVSGLFFQLDRPAKIGDPIEVVEMNVSGVVNEITPFSTRLRRFDGVFIRIPNEKIFTSQLVNFFGYMVRRVEVMVGIAYKEDASTVIQLIREMAARNPKILAEPEPTIMVWELADSSVNIKVWVWVPSQEWFPVRTEITQQLKELLDKEGIEMPFPHRTIWFGESKTGVKDVLSVAIREGQTGVGEKQGSVSESRKSERRERSKLDRQDAHLDDS